MGENFGRDKGLFSEVETGLALCGSLPSAGGTALLLYTMLQQALKNLSQILQGSGQ